MASSNDPALLSAMNSSRERALGSIISASSLKDCQSLWALEKIRSSPRRCQSGEGRVRAYCSISPRRRSLGLVMAKVFMQRTSMSNNLDGVKWKISGTMWDNGGVNDTTA